MSGHRTMRQVQNCHRIIPKHPASSLTYPSTCRLNWINNHVLTNFTAPSPHKDCSSPSLRLATIDFNQLGINKHVCNALSKNSITTPTEVQISAVLNILKGKDTVIASPTGTGKTLAYTLPLVNTIYDLHDALLKASEEDHEYRGSALSNFSVGYRPASIHTSDRRLNNPWEATGSYNPSIKDYMKQSADNRGTSCSAISSLRKLAPPAPPIIESSLLLPKSNKYVWDAAALSLKASTMVVPSSFGLSNKLLGNAINDHRENASSVYYGSSTYASFYSMLNNPFHAFRPWVILVPNRDLVSQVCALLQSIDPFNRLVIQTFTDSPSYPLHENGPIHDNLFQEDMSSCTARGVLIGGRIRWGAVDVVVGTVDKFVEDLERFNSDRLYPGCVIFDEVDILFHSSNTRSHVLDIIYYLRRRLPIRHPYEVSVLKASHQNVTVSSRNRSEPEYLVPCQFVFVGATIPKLGVTSVGCMLPERFTSSSTVSTADMHKIKINTNQQWVDIESPISNEVNEIMVDNNRKNTRTMMLEEDFNARLDKLILSLKTLEQGHGRSIIFTDTIDYCVRVFDYLDKHKWPVVSYHGSMSMYNRMSALEIFNRGQATIMVATDLCSRGLHISSVDITHVINFHFPTNVVTYLHRAGRINRMTPYSRAGASTARGGASDPRFRMMSRIKTVFTEADNYYCVINFVNRKIEGVLADMIRELGNSGLSRAMSKNGRIGNKLRALKKQLLTTSGKVPYSESKDSIVSRRVKGGDSFNNNSENSNSNNKCRGRKSKNRNSKEAGNRTPKFLDTQTAENRCTIAAPVKKHSMARLVLGTERIYN